MTTMGLMRSFAVLAVLGMPVSSVGAATLTADDAVKIALERNSSIIGSQAGVLQGRSGVRSSLGSIAPSLSASLSRSHSRTVGEPGTEQVLGPSGIELRDVTNDATSKATNPAVSMTWNPLNLSSWAGLSSARSELRAARQTLQATRNEVALATRRQFYEVVKAVKLSEVSEGALQLARDDERRVKAMFEVGSVSKSDLLKAQVRTAQSEFDALAARHAITVQRVALGSQLGIKEADLGDVDTLLTAEPRTFDEPSLLAEAARNRPDLQAAESGLQSAKAGLSATRLARLPYVTASGQIIFKPRSSFRQENEVRITEFSGSSDRVLQAQIGLRMDLFNLATLDARSASARATLLRAQDERDALQRNLASEVHEQLLAYTEAVEQNKVAQRGLESATENLKLTQEKYNVGSATILELIDAQVQLQTAKSNVVRALAAIRVAEAQINRVRGQSQ